MISDSNSKTIAVTTIVGIAHIICGIAAIYVPDVLDVSPMAGLHDLIALAGWPSYAGGLVLLIVGSLAVFASGMRFVWHVTLLMPQQFLLTLQVWSISVALVTGVYPDGYVPIGGPWFILTDQIWAWMLTVSHSVWLTAYIYQGLRQDGAFTQRVID